MSMKGPVSYESTKIRGSKFHDVDLGETSFTDVNLSKTVFRDVNLTETSFDDVNLSKTVFRDVALTDSNIQKSKLTNLRIDDSRLDGMKIDGVLVSDLLRVYRANGGEPKIPASSENLGTDVPNKLHVTEIKAFIPARDFGLSKQFYKDIGFNMASEGGGVAYFYFAAASFLLQDFCAESFAGNFMMHMLVKDVEAWWNRISESGVTETYGVTLSNIELQPWRMRDFCLTDPTGVLWRIGQNVP